jgi:hypothetical protein
MTKPNGASSDGPTIKPIETVYRGHRMRSRLEARWAVFMDCLGIEWEYEKEGYDLDGVWYLPDFWLPKQGMWMEVKGSGTGDWKNKAERLSLLSGHPVAVFIGDCAPVSHSHPGFKNTARIARDGAWQHHAGCWVICENCGHLEINGHRDGACPSSGKICSGNITYFLSFDGHSPRILTAFAIAKHVRLDDREFMGKLSPAALTDYTVSAAANMMLEVLSSDFARAKFSSCAEALYDDVNDEGPNSFNPAVD